jgi:hypothetical protein
VETFVLSAEAFSTLASLLQAHRDFARRLWSSIFKVNLEFSGAVLDE